MKKWQQVLLLAAVALACIALVASQGQNFPGGGGGGYAGTNPQSGNYTLVQGDDAKLIVMSGTNAILTLANPAPAAPWLTSIANTSGNAIQINVNGRTVNGSSANFPIASLGGMTIYSDGTNYFASGNIGSVCSNGYCGSGNLDASFGVGAGGSAFINMFNGTLLQANNGIDTILMQNNGSTLKLTFGADGTLQLVGPMRLNAGSKARLLLADQGSCVMAAGTCAAQSLGTTYTTAPICMATVITAGGTQGTLRAPSTTTTVTPASSNAADTSTVGWTCFGN